MLPSWYVEQSSLPLLFLPPKSLSVFTEVDEDDLLTIDFLHPEKNMADFDFENSRWEDEDTRTFHENLIDLRTMVPAVSNSCNWILFF